MSVTLKTQVMLWGRAAHRCAFPDCRLPLVIDPTETDDESLIGEVCHIVARSAEGPRGASPLTSIQRDKYANLILLCRIHHKIVDDQAGTYTIERLCELKGDHEKWVKESLGDFDPAEQRDKEIYASYVEEFAKRADLDSWRAWSSGLFSSGYQHISKVDFERLRELKEWIFTRVWPHRLPELEDAFTNFRYVLQDLQITFEKNSTDLNDETLHTEKFYQISEYDPKLYHYLSAKYDFYEKLVDDLMLELTRAANYICDLVRRFLDPGFRLAEGVLVVDGGLYMDMAYHTFRVEYRKEERAAIPYPGLVQFKEIRISRDHHIGSGHGPDGKQDRFE